MNTALSYAGRQLLMTEEKGYGEDVQYQAKRAKGNGHADIKQPIRELEEGAAMTNRQWRMYYEKIAEIRRGESEAFAVTRDGKFILAIENKLIYTDGDWDNPTIERMVEIHLEDETDIDEVRYIIALSEMEDVHNERYRGILESLSGEGAISRYDRAVFGKSEGNSHQNRETKRNGYTRSDQRNRSEASSSRRNKEEVNAGDDYSFKNTQAEKTLNQNGIELLNGDTATMQYSLKKIDLAKSVSDDATLYAQVKNDQVIADAMRLVTRLHYSQQGATNWDKRYHKMNQR